MTISYTALLGLAQPVTGTETGQWGTVVNDEITALLEDAVANAASISVTAGNVTLSTTNGSSNQARMSTLIITGTPGTTRNVVAPSQAKIYVVINQSDGAVVIKGAATSGVTIGAGQTAQVAWNGSDFVEIGNYVHGNFVVNGNLSVNGDSTLGNAGADTTTINGQVIAANSNISKTTTLSASAPALAWIKGATYTDTGTAGGTTQALAPFTVFSTPTLSTSNIVTYTDAATVYIAGAPAAAGSATITNPYSLYVAAGNAYFGGTVTAGTVNFTTLDLTNLEVTNIKAKDGTASMTLADSTGVVTFSANPVLNAGTANGVPYLNGSKVLTTGSALTFDGTNFALTGKFSVSQNSVGLAAEFTNADATNGYGVSIAAGGTSATRYALVVRNPASTQDYFKISTVTGEVGHSIFAPGAPGSSEIARFTTTGLGIGTNSPSQKLTVVGNALVTPTGGWTTGGVATQYFGDVYGSIKYDYNTTNFLISSYSSFSIATNGTSPTTRLTLDSSGNLGLGVTPTAAYGGLQIVGPTSASLYTQQGIDVVRAGVRASGRTGIVFDSSDATYTNRMWYIANEGASGSLDIGRSGLSVLTMSNSGNLGLGVTPSAWASDWKVMQIGGRSAFAQYNVNASAIVANNVYFAGAGGSNPTYIDTAAASFYQQVNGQHNWYNAASGTAGNAISFTQAMTLDALGNLGVGATSPNFRLEVRGSVVTNGDAIRNMAVISTNSASAGLGGGIAFGGYYNGTTNDINDFAGIQGFKENGTAGDYAGALRFTTRVNGGTPTERARITSGGNLDLQKNIGLGGASATTSGTGITFPATQSASSDANTLDDYEEGTHTTSITCGTSGTVTLDSAFDLVSYTKIGRQVTVTGQIAVDSVSSPVGFFSISLPFAIADLSERAGRGAVSFVIQGTTSANISEFVSLTVEGESAIRIYLGNATVVSAASAQQLQALTDIWFTITYFV